MPEVVIGIFLVVIGMIAIIAIVQHLNEKKRTESLRKLADELNFEFFPKGKPQLTAALAQFQLFNIGRARQMWNLLSGYAGGLELNIFDYRYTTGSGKSQRTWKKTVFAARCRDMDLPQFNMRPETVWNKIGAWLGFKDIDFDSHPIFSRLYYLKGADEGAIRALFSPEILEYFEGHHGLNVEAMGDVVLYYTMERRKPEGIRAFMTDGFAILKLFRPGDRPEPAEQ